jgi:signal transduction histidine kinase
MRADSAVEPTRSENITVTWRRSAVSCGATVETFSLVSLARLSLHPSFRLSREATDGDDQATHPSDLSEVKEALECVVADANRAGAIVERIRDQIKKAHPRKDRFDLNEAIVEVIVLARSTITENEVSVQTRLTEGLFPVHGDRVQVQQVILNLVLNAVEAMSSVEAGARELLISTDQSETNSIVVAVRDSGPGVDPEDHERVFQAFYTTKSSGVGIGLSICRSIIEAHGGQLWADANEPCGAVFQFTLPNAETS